MGACASSSFSATTTTTTMRIFDLMFLQSVSQSVVIRSFVHLSALTAAAAAIIKFVISQQISQQQG
jgi:hypothetical protein